MSSVFPQPHSPQRMTGMPHLILTKMAIILSTESPVMQ